MHSVQSLSKARDFRITWSNSTAHICMYDSQPYLDLKNFLPLASVEGNKSISASSWRALYPGDRNTFIE